MVVMEANDSQAHMAGAVAPGSAVLGIAATKGVNLRRMRLLGTLVVAITAVSLVVAAGASGQGALDQYSPVRDAPGSGASRGGAEANPFGEAVPGSALGPAASSASVATGGGEELPFTGYPLTPLIIALLILLATGVALRIAVEVHERLGDRR